MRIAIFGGSGFLGSHVADVLTSQNHDVVIFDKKTSPYLQEEQEMIIGDILDLEAVSKTVKGCDVVYNFAGIADIDAAKKDPLNTISTNVLGNSNILEACRSHNVKRFVLASTVYVYSEAGSFYRASKQSCELITECFNKQFNLDFTTLRYGSLYGPRADHSNWVFQILNQALEEKKIIRNGDGEEIREYIHVYDAARLSAKVLDPEYRNQYVMITGQQSISIRNLMIMIKEILNNEIDLEFRGEPEEQHYEITPYNFRPKLAKRINDTHCVDLGQGILDLIQTIHDKVAREKSKRP